MATIEIIELENKDIANGDVCHMNYAVIYKADNVTNVNHNWNTITFSGSLKPVDGANSACESGQCEQRRLEVGECVVYKDGNTYTQCSVLSAGADDKYTIAQFDYVGNTDAFSADQGSGVIQQYFKPRRTEIPNVSRVKLKTVNHVVKITDAASATGKQTLYYTDFLDTTQLFCGKVVSKTVFINLDEQTYLPFWCEPTIGFVAVPDEGNQPVQQLAWTHYMDWCSDLYKYIDNPSEACAAYMYTYVKVSPVDVAAYCSRNAVNINVEQEKILRVLGKMAPSPGNTVPRNTVPNPPMIVPNPPMIYMRRRLLTNTPLYQIHSPDDTQLYVNEAREVTQSIINNQHFPFVCLNNTNDSQFDTLESFSSWTQRKNRIGKKILVLTDDVEPLENMGFNLVNQNQNSKYKIYTNSDNMTLYVANVFGVEACKNALIQANSWWEDKGFYYVNYGNNYNEFYGIKPFVDSDKKCGLDTGIMKGGDDNDDLQTGGVGESNSLCISTQNYKYILFDPTEKNNNEPFEWTVLKFTNNIEYKKYNLSGAVLQQMCKDAHEAIVKKYEIDVGTNYNELYKELYKAVPSTFSFIFVEHGEERNIEFGLKNFIDNLLKINVDGLKDTFEDFATNIIIVSPKQIQPDKKKINEANYINNFIVYWGFLNTKRMKPNTDNTGVVFESPLPGSKPFDVPFNEFKATIAGGDMAGGGGAGTPKGASKSNAKPDQCAQRLKFDKIEDFKTLRDCIDNIEINDFSPKPTNAKVITVNAIKQNAETISNSVKKNFYSALHYNITSMVQPIVNKNTKSIQNTTAQKLYNELLNIDEINNIQKNNYTINSLTLTQVIGIIDIILNAYKTHNVSKLIEPKPAPAPVQESSLSENLSQQIHIQITFTVCKLNSDKTIKSTDSTCYHKAYIKSVVPRSADHSECSDVVNNANNIYEATKALYAYKNKGYRLVKLVPGKEHAYFAEHPEGFVKQAVREVTEYKLGESVPTGEPLENTIETSELIKDIGYADGLDVAFLASNPDSTDLENMAMLRNGISYAI